MACSDLQQFESVFDTLRLLERKPGDGPVEFDFKPARVSKGKLLLPSLKQQSSLTSNEADTQNGPMSGWLFYLRKDQSL